MNFDYKLIILNTLCTMYFILKYDFSILIPIISLINFTLLKFLNLYYNSIEYYNYQKENRVGYEIYEKNIFFSPVLLFLISLLSITNMYELQIFVSILLIYIKLENYEYVRLVDNNYYLLNLKLTQTIILSTFLLMCHYSELINTHSNITNKIIIFLSQNAIFTIDYDINIIN